MNPHQVTRDFEEALCNYTGAKFAVTTTSCTMAITLALAWFRHRHGETVVGVPKRTYVGVPSAVLNSGHRLAFYDDPDWEDCYFIGPYQSREDECWWRVQDCAWEFKRGMFRDAHLSHLDKVMQCLSFHWSKPLGLGQGGAILLDCEEANSWLRRARFDGRTEGVKPEDDVIQYPNWHAYLSPETSATGLMRLHSGAFRTDRIACATDYPVKS